MTVWCGIDWAERHHDVALVDDDGKLLVKPELAHEVDLRVGIAVIAGL